MRSCPSCGRGTAPERTWLGVRCPACGARPFFAADASMAVMFVAFAATLAGAVAVFLTPWGLMPVVAGGVVLNLAARRARRELFGV